jgi:hypothetical protein
MRDEPPAVHRTLVATSLQDRSEGAVPHAERARLRAAIVENFEAIWCFLRRLGLSPPDADDAAQDVMMVVAKKLPIIAPGRAVAGMLRGGTGRPDIVANQSDAR